MPCCHNHERGDANALPCGCYQTRKRSIRPPLARSLRSKAYHIHVYRFPSELLAHEIQPLVDHVAVAECLIDPGQGESCGIRHFSRKALLRTYRPGAVKMPGTVILENDA